MGLFKNLFNGKKKKFSKLTSEDVVNAYIELEQKEENLENELSIKKKEINELIEKGKKTNDHDQRLVYAKKISFLQDSCKATIKRIQYVLYNLKLMEKLKNAVEENEFLLDVGSVDLNALLSNQKGLAAFLNKSLKTKVKAEDIMTSADDTFNEIDSQYEENEDIYGIKDSDDSIMAIFEDSDNIELFSDNSNEEKDLQKDK